MFALAASNAALAYNCYRQGAMLDEISTRQKMGAVRDGQTISTLVGTRMSTGQKWVVNADASHIAVLVFREGCHYCDQNWKNWDQLFASSHEHLPPIFITQDKQISEVYKKLHPLLQKSTVLLDVDPASISPLNPGLTPQTLYVSEGRVKHDWLGVLDKADVEQASKVFSISE
jgi:hypothetical protein